MVNTLTFIDWGLCDYADALRRQKTLWLQRRKNEIPDTLILTEHLPVFTICKHGKRENRLVSEAVLKSKNITLHHIERGGDITFHGPGQIIGYPIFKIKQPLVGIRQFIHNLEQILINTLASFNIQAIKRTQYIGIWVEDKKIASLGIAIAKHVSFHGFALNVSTDLTYFDLINPCGIKEIKMTSVEQILQRKIPIELIKTVIKNQFIKVFNF